MILSFLLLTVCYIAENLFRLFGKSKEAVIFHKIFIVIFLLFTIGFLIAWSYAWIKEQQYFPLLFTIPLWIFEIYIFRKSILGIQSNSGPIEKRNKFDARIILSCFLVICILLSGIICLVIGIKDTYHTYQNTKNYLPATSYLKDYEVKGEDDKITYHVIYAYEIDGKEYTIQTDSDAIDNIRKIKYDPNNPHAAVFTDTYRNNGFIYMGAFFLLGGMVFVLAYLYAKGAFDKVKINVLGIYIGFVFFVVGIGIMAFQMQELSSFMEVAEKMGIWILIPIMLIIIGGFQMIRCLFFEREMNHNRKK